MDIETVMFDGLVLCRGDAALRNSRRGDEEWLYIKQELYPLSSR